MKLTPLSGDGNLMIKDLQIGRITMSLKLTPLSGDGNNLISAFAMSNFSFGFETNPAFRGRKQVSYYLPYIRKTLSLKLTPLSGDGNTTIISLHPVLLV